MSVIKLTSQNFEEEVLKSTVPVLVDFWAEWCNPCRMMAPTVDTIGEELKDKIKVAKINIDEAPEIAEQYGVMSIPTFKLFKNGQETASTVGVQDKNELIRNLGL